MEAMGKSGSPGDQAVECRGLDFMIVEGIEGPKALVISDQDEKIWLSPGSGRFPGPQCSGRQQHRSGQAAHGFEKGPAINA
jgi:hypothetical protein